MANRTPAPRAAAGLALALLGCVGCGTQVPEGAPSRSGSAAAGTAVGESPRPGAQVDGSKLAGRVRTATDAAGSVRMRTTMPGQGTVSVLDQVRISERRVDTSGTSDGALLRMVGDRYYVAYPDAPQRWFARPTDTTSPAREAVRAVRATESPARAAVYREGETTYLGSTSRNGTRLRHYRTRTRADRALALFVPTLSPTALARQSGKQPITYDTWIDARDRPARMVVTVPGAEGAGEAISTRTTFERWGVPVKVTAPSADRTTRLEEQSATGS